MSNTIKYKTQNNTTKETKKNAKTSANMNVVYNAILEFQVHCCHDDHTQSRMVYAAIHMVICVDCNNMLALNPSRRSLE